MVQFKRRDMEEYMIDCHGFDQDELSEWQTKDDLLSDIKSFGWLSDFQDYCGV